MGELTDEVCQNQLDCVRRRLEALDKIEAKLRQMRELAVYAASRSLSETETAQVQEWVDILQADVIAMDKATPTPWVEGDLPAKKGTIRID